MHLGILSSPLCKFELKEVIPAFLDTGESWSLISGCGWLVMWAEGRQKALVPPPQGEAAAPVPGCVQKQEMLPAEHHIPTGERSAA